MEDPKDKVQLNTEDEDIQYTFVLKMDGDVTYPEIPAVPQDDPAAEDGSEDQPTVKDEPEDEPTVKEASEDEPTVVVKDKADGKTTRYGLPLGHPETGDLAVKMEERRRDTLRRKRSFRTRFYAITGTLVFIIAALLFSLSSFFTVDSITVKGNSHYSAEEIINIAHATPGRNIFYGSNLDEITDYLLQNPYIKKAKVTRRLPSTLVIKVTERTEKMAFKYDDDYLIMDGEGILLKKTRNEPKTTIIEGIVVSKIKLGEKIGTEDKKRTEKVIDLIKKTAEADLYFVKVDISDEDKVKAYIYDNMVVKTDYETLMANIENGRLHRVLEELIPKGVERGTITFEEDGSASFMPTF